MKLEEITEEEIFKNLFPEYCAGEKCLSPYFDLFQIGFEEGEKQNEELELKIKHLTEHLEPQAMTSLFEQVEEEVRQEQRIEELEKENTELKTKKIPQLERKIASMHGTHQKGADFGYNKANEWHYVKDKLPPNPKESGDGFSILPLNYICAYDVGDGDYECDEFMYLGDGVWNGENEKYPVYAWLEHPVEVPKPRKENE